MFLATPRVVDGTDPAPVWIFLDTAENNVFNYTAMEELQGSRCLPVKHFSITSFSKTGRQDDFNYWYDVQTMASNVAIRLHSEATPTMVKFWQFQLAFQVDFRGLSLFPTNEKVQVVQLSESPQQVVQEQVSKEVKAKEVKEKEVEDEDEVWNHVDSDWDDVE
jgi:hypothetical protein